MSAYKNVPIIAAAMIVLPAVEMLAVILMTPRMMTVTHLAERTAIPVTSGRHVVKVAVTIAIVPMEEAIAAINVKLMSMAA